MSDGVDKEIELARAQMVADFSDKIMSEILSKIMNILDDAAESYIREENRATKEEIINSLRGSVEKISSKFSILSCEKNEEEEKEMELRRRSAEFLFKKWCRSGFYGPPSEYYSRYSQYDYLSEIDDRETECENVDFLDSPGVIENLKSDPIYLLSRRFQYVFLDALRIGDQDFVKRVGSALLESASVRKTNSLVVLEVNRLLKMLHRYGFIFWNFENRIYSELEMSRGSIHSDYELGIILGVLENLQKINSFKLSKDYQGKTMMSKHLERLFPKKSEPLQNDAESDALPKGGESLKNNWFVLVGPRKHRLACG